MKRWILGLATIGLSGCVGHLGDDTRVREPFSHQLAVSGSPTLQLDNIAGTVTVDGWNKPIVEVAGEKTGPDQATIDRVHVDVHQQGSTITVATNYGRGFTISNGGVNYVIHVPVDSDIKVNNIAGTITLSDLAGTVNADTHAGTIKATLSSVDGKHPVTLNATTGTIRLQMPKDSNGVVQAKSTIGSVRSDFPIDTSKSGLGASANGKIGSGGAPIKLSTTTGSIALETR
jgi:hypothetical protein